MEQTHKKQKPPLITLAIVGSRTFNDYDKLKEEVDKFIDENDINVQQFVSGGANGADTLAEIYAKRKELPIIVLKPDWKKHGKSAGYLRNKDIINEATHCIAFPSKQGKGTQHSIELAKQKGIPIKIVFID